MATASRARHAGQVVYVNYGRPEDYVAIEKMGIDVKGKIVLVRYGSLFRGLKVRNAQKRGAAGILIFSDPADDGFAKGDVYPHGRFRPGSAIQRGSVQFLSLGPGDPSTPFGPSVKGAKRLPIDRDNGFPSSAMQWEKTTGLKRDDYFATIPCLPISYDTAHEILKVLAGANVPSGWQGGLPLPYHVGPGPARSAVVGGDGLSDPHDLERDRHDPRHGRARPLGHDRQPSRCLGLWSGRPGERHGRDHGDVPRAGRRREERLEAAPHAPVRELGRRGIRPGRLDRVGRAEQRRRSTKRPCSCSMSTRRSVVRSSRPAACRRCASSCWTPPARSSTREPASRSARPGPKPIVRPGRPARHSSSSDPLWDVDGQRRLACASRTAGPPAGSSRNWASLGSGSDFTAFLDHLAVPAIDVGFHGGYGVYHSIYDDFNWMEKFGDPEFLTHATAARLYTLIAMRAAAADVVPFKFVPYGVALREHVDELRLIHAQRVRKADPAKTDVEPEFAGLSQPGRGRSRRFRSRPKSSTGPPRRFRNATRWIGAELAKLNDSLAQVERAFLLEKGLPDRPWFKHAIYAPGLTTGYAAWPLPAIRQALEDNNKARLAADLPPTVERIKKATAAMESARKHAQAITRHALRSDSTFTSATSELLSGTSNDEPSRNHGSPVGNVAPRAGAGRGLLRGCRLGDRLGDLPGPGEGRDRCSVHQRHHHGVGHRRALQRGGGTHAGRAGCDAASSRRPLRLPSRGLWRTAGVPVWLGRVSDRAVGVDGDPGGGLRTLLRGAGAAARDDSQRDLAGGRGHAGDRDRHRGQRPGNAAGRNTSGRRHVLESRRRPGLDRTAVSLGAGHHRQPRRRCGPAPAADRSSRG